MFMSKEKQEKKKKEFKLPTAYTILLALTAVIALITQVIPGVQSSSLSDVVMAPINGMNDAIDIVLFVIFIGGFLGIVTATGALDAGVGAIVKKLKGKELMLIPVLMFIFSLGGTSYGMAEETIAFYALITTTMMVAGFDPIVSVGTIMLGAGCGVLGSTVNPFLVGASMDALASVGVEVNQGIVIALSTALWLSSLLVSIYFVMSYAKKVKANPQATLLSEAEMEEAKKAHLSANADEIEFTGKRKGILAIFFITFAVMVVSVIPWESFGINIFANTDFLTGASLGNWWFGELSIWFALMAIIIGLIAGMKEKEIVNNFMIGASDMIGVALVLGISRGVSVIMSSTGLDGYLLSQASGILSDVSPLVFVNMSYIIYIGLSILVPSTSGLANISMPIFGPLTQSLGFSPELVIAVFSAGSGIVNLVTPTSGVVMGGLAVAKVEYSTWLKFVGKVLLAIFISSVIVLSVGMMILV